MILRFKNTNNQAISSIATKFNTIDLNLDIDFESIPTGSGRILHNFNQIGTFQRTAGSPVTINIVDGNFCRKVNHNDKFMLIVDDPIGIDPVELTINRAHFTGIPKLPKIIKTATEYISPTVFPKIPTNDVQEHILIQYEKQMIPKHMSQFVLELLKTMRDIPDTDKHTFPSSDAFYCNSGIPLIIPVSNILVNDKFRVGGVLVGGTTTNDLEIINVKNATGGTVSTTLFNNRISSITFNNTTGVNTTASFVCEIKNRLTNEIIDSLVRIYIKAPHPVNVINDVYNLTQWDTLTLTKAQLIANDLSTYPPISFVEIISNSVVNGNVSVVGSNVIFTSTGFAGHPASFQYRIKDANNNTAIGTVNINILELPTIEAFIWETSEELADNFYTPPTFLDIFNTWPRFCHDPGVWTDPADPADLEYWVYEAEYDRVRYNLHAHPRLNGLYSLEPLENYVHQATIVGNDDDSGSWDSEGLVIAVNEDSSGKLHTLTVQKSVGQNFTNYLNVQNGVMTTNVAACGYAVVYDCLRPSEWIVQQSQITVPPKGSTARGYNDGALYNLRLNPVGFTLKVERIGDTIRCLASSLNSTILDPSSELVIDLNSDPRLAQFKGRKPYGYCVFSQPGVSWVNVSMSGGLDATKLYDMEMNVVWEYANGTWINTGRTIQEELGYPRTITNPKNGISYRIEATTITKL